MKITKKKEVVVEEIEIGSGEYYFECQEGVSHKMILCDYDNGEGLDYFYESVESYDDAYGIRVRTDTAFDGEDFPYKFSSFIRGISGKKIEKEEYNKVKQQVLERL